VLADGLFDTIVRTRLEVLDFSKNPGFWCHKAVFWLICKPISATIIKAFLSMCRIEQ
jgi:hypothetical protein